jgi:hypothetical protein
MTPGRWPPPIYALIGAALLLTGIALGVPSAILGGSCCIAFDTYRSRLYLGRLAARIDLYLAGRPPGTPKSRGDHRPRP